MDSSGAGISRQPLPPMPARIARLPRDARGFPIPWFVHREADGTPDFRVVRRGGFADAIRGSRCWVCGEALGRTMAFVIGPMCAVTRTTSEPPCHRDCAEWSVAACPFLLRPRMRRNEQDLPEDKVGPAGFALDRNPGVPVVWVTRGYKTFRTHGAGGSADGVLITVGDPLEVLWLHQGRPATRAEAVASIQSGLPALEKMARDEGPQAVAELARFLNRAGQYLPADVAA